MNIIFFGSDDFAAANLQGIVDGTHKVLACVTQPDRPRGRGLQLTPSPVKVCARDNDLAIWQPAGLTEGDIAGELAAYNADLFVVIAYGLLLPPAILDIPHLFCLNAHASLLPKYRGAAPIHWAIINGEAETGVTMIRMTPKLDAGDIISQESIPVEPEDTTATLRSKLAQLSADCLLATLDQIEAGQARFIPQDSSAATYAPKLDKETSRIDWSDPAARINNLIRGLLPKPAAHTFLDGKMIKILRAESTPVSPEAAQPGQILDISPAGILVGTGKGTLLLVEVRPESSRDMTASAFAAGHRIMPGRKFG